MMVHIGSTAGVCDANPAAAVAAPIFSHLHPGLTPWANFIPPLRG